MTAGAHDADSGLGGAGGANAARGLAVIAIAVLVGFFLMARGIDDSTVAAGDDTTSTTAAEETVVEESTTITTAPPAEDEPETTDDTLGARRPPAEVLTLALNGTDPIVSGAAGSMRNLLESNGYAVADPKNADAPAPSGILFVEGYESDARGVAELLGVDVSVVRPFDAASSPISDTQGAQVIVVVGNDGIITS